MSKPAFFVDGQTEQRALNKLCPGHPIRIIGCNGKTVSMSAIAKRLASLIKVLNNRNYPIVILIDRETRPQDTKSIKEELHLELKKLEVHDDVMIGVCDRMIENWILADKGNVSKYCSKKINWKKQNFEGAKGKSELKKHMKSYHETTDGVNLLSTSNPKYLYKNSLSFKEFVHTIEKIECNWLEGLIYK